MLVGLGLCVDSPHLKQHKGRRGRWDHSVGMAGNGGDAQQFILPKLSEAIGLFTWVKLGFLLGHYETLTTM